MNTNLQSKPALNRPKSGGVNPFARALAETEQSLQHGPKTGDNTNLFSDALAKTGGSFDFNNWPAKDQSPQEAQAKFEKQRRHEMLRQQLHDKVNPVDLVDVYNAREEQVKKEINKLREDLKFLAMDVKKFEKEIQLTLMTEVANPGQDGKYYLAFFQKLRAFIMLLRQKIKSAGTWATQINGKQRKRAKKGMTIGGAAHQKTSTIQDMMHHERSTQFSGG